MFNPFRLEKLEITGYSSVKRAKADYVGRFEALFNPETLKQQYAILYGKDQGMNSTGRKVNYSRNRPGELSLKLLLDGTGVDVPGYRHIVGARRKTVAEQIKAFLDLTFRMNGKIHEPNFLVVQWGDLIFSCRLATVDIVYTSFNRDGTALRAELDISLLGDQEVRKRMAIENKSSPDLTHSRVVRSGDSLPQLTREIYGSSRHYLWVARVNRLDDFRRIEPGTTLYFPPLPAAQA